MNLFQIDNEVLQCVDLETGEIINEELLEKLELARDKKIENIALWIKNLNAEAEALKAEKMEFAKRQQVAENKAKGLKEYLSKYLNGNKYSSTKVNISFRKSETLEIEDVRNVPVDFLIEQEPKVDKAGLKKLLKNGDCSIMGVKLVSNNNIQIK